MEQWLKSAKISDDGISYLTKTAKIVDGSSLLLLHSDEEYKNKIENGITSYSDLRKFNNELDALMDHIAPNDEDQIDNFNDVDRYGVDDDDDAQYPDDDLNDNAVDTVNDGAFNDNEVVFGGDGVDEAVAQREDVAAARKYNLLRSRSSKTQSRSQRIDSNYGVQSDEQSDGKYSGLSDGGYAAKSYKTRPKWKTKRVQRRYENQYDDDNDDALRYDMNGVNGIDAMNQWNDREDVLSNNVMDQMNDFNGNALNDLNAVNSINSVHSENEQNPNLFRFDNDQNDGDYVRDDDDDDEAVDFEDDLDGDVDGDEYENGQYREQDLEDFEDVDDVDDVDNEVNDGVNGGNALNDDMAMKRGKYGYSKKYEDTPMMKKYYSSRQRVGDNENGGYGQIEEMEEKELREEEEERLNADDDVIADDDDVIGDVIEDVDDQESEGMDNGVDEYIGDKLKEGISNFDQFRMEREREEEGDHVVDAQNVMNIESLMSALETYCISNGDDHDFHPICECLEGMESERGNEEGDGVQNGINGDDDDEDRYGHSVRDQYGREYQENEDDDDDDDDDYDDGSSDLEGNGMNRVSYRSQNEEDRMDGLRYKYGSDRSDDGDDDRDYGVGVEDDNEDESGYVPVRKSYDSESSGLAVDGVEPPRLIRDDMERYNDNDDLGDLDDLDDSDDSEGDLEDDYDDEDDIDSKDLKDLMGDIESDAEIDGETDSERLGEREYAELKGLDSERYAVDDAVAALKMDIDDLDDDDDDEVVDDDRFGGMELGEVDEGNDIESDNESERRLSVSYNVEDVGSDQKTLSRRIVFDVDTGAVVVDGLWYLEWCAEGNPDDYCSSTSFAEKEAIQISLFPQIAYRFTIRSEDGVWKWNLDDFVDDEPNSGWFPMSAYTERVTDRMTQRE